MIFYAYFGYPLCLLIISVFKRSNHQDHYELSATNYHLPSVSFIITAYNEEARIKQKIENSLAQNYPKDKLKIIIASDCSSDKTDEIVKSFKLNLSGHLKEKEKRTHKNMLSTQP